MIPSRTTIIIIYKEYKRNQTKRGGVYIKKVFVLFLMLSVLSGCFIIPTSAADNSKANPTEKKFMYLDKLYEQEDIYNLPQKELINDDEAIKYDEVYYHTNETGNTDWALVYLYIQWGGSDAIVSEIIGGRHIYLASPAYPFTIRYAIYDVKKNYFYNLPDTNNYAPTDVFERYDGLYEVWQTLDLSEISPEVLLGDTNGDRSVDIVDATYIQRYLISIVSKYDIVSVAADYDKDEEITILDATKIQRALVGVN